MIAKLSALLRHLGKKFSTPKFSRWEIVIMRVLFAYVIYQSMPLDKPFNAAGLGFLEKVAPGAAAKVKEDFRYPLFGIRPPFFPLIEAMPGTTGKIEYSDTPVPVGLARTGWGASFVKLFNDEAFVTKVLPWFVFGALALYVSGYGLPVALPILTLISIGSRTLFNSQGRIHHGFQIISLVLLAQTVVILWQVWKNWRVAMGAKKAADDVYGRNFWDYLFRWSQLAIIAAYVIAGVIKPIQSKGLWFANSHFIGVQIVKTHRQNYYNALDPALKDRDVPLARDFMYERKNMWRILMSMGVLLEIFAFLALYNRWMMAGVGFAMVMFHYMNDTFMELYFYNNEKMLWIFLVNIPGLVIGLMQLLKKRGSPPASDVVPVAA